jgi:hypothetical protein
MARAGELRALDPRRGGPASGPGGSYQRVLVPVDSSGWSNAALAAAIRVGDQVNGELRVVHVRTWDRPGRFFFETFAEATSVVDSALAGAWACGDAHVRAHDRGASRNHQDEPAGRGGYCRNPRGRARARTGGVR